MNADVLTSCRESYTLFISKRLGQDIGPNREHGLSRNRVINNGETTMELVLCRCELHLRVSLSLFFRGEVYTQKRHPVGCLFEQMSPWICTRPNSEKTRQAEAHVLLL